MSALAFAPMYPIRPVADSSAAAAPTRYEPCSTAKSMATVFGNGGSVASMIAKRVSGNSSAMSRNAACMSNGPIDDPAPSAAIRRVSGRSV